MDDKSVSTSQKLSFELETQLNPEEWIIDPRPVTSAIKEFLKQVNYHNLWIKLIH